MISQIKNTQPQLLMLMDGHAMVHRAWHAIPYPLTLATTLEDVRGVYAFTNAFLKAIQEWRPTHCAIAFDLPSPTFRHQMFTEYKAHRPPTPDDLRAQFPWVRKLMEAFNVPIFEATAYEADDVLGTLCRQATEAGIDSIILTGDTDTLQLVSPSVKVVLNRSVRDQMIYDEAAVRERYAGLNPVQQPDIKALQGDSSDNIPGIPKVGIKTAIKLIQDFGSIDGIYSNIDKVSPDKLRDTLVLNEDLARKCLTLTTIVTNAPVSMTLEDCRFWSYSRENVLDLLRTLEFNSIVPRVPDPTQSRQTLPPDSYLTTQPEVHYETILDPERLSGFLNEIRKLGAFTFDVETTSKSAMVADLVGISFSLKSGSASYVPVGHQTGTQLALETALNMIKPIMEDPTISKISHNASYDMTVLANYGIDVNGLTFDTMVAAHILGEQSLGLKNLAFNKFNLEMSPIQSIIGTGRNQKTMAEVPIDIVSEYAAADADMTGRLQTIFHEGLKSKDRLWDLFNQMELPLVPVLVRMQRNGISLDGDRLRHMSVILGNRLEEIEGHIFDTVGHKFALNSPKQLGDILFNHLNLPRTRRTKTGYSTDASSLESLKESINLGDHTNADPRAPQVLESILEYRELSKLKSTYVDSLPSLVNFVTGRLHTSYNQTGSATGRVSSNDPNLQNIPVRTELGREVRKAFIAQQSPKSTLLSADYSQIELRILAHLSMDVGLVEAFLRDEDIHTATAAQVYGVPLDAVVPDMRRIAKIMNFGVIYGLSAFGIARQTGLTREEGANFIDSYFSRYPGIRDYLQRTKKLVSDNGYLETMSGRRRYLPEANSPNFQIRQAAERMAVNMPIQGTAADILKIAMVNIDQRMQREKLSSKMVLQVHDELIFDVPDIEIETMTDIVLELMPSAMNLVVPLKVDLKRGPTWGDLE